LRADEGIMRPAGKGKSDYGTGDEKEAAQPSNVFVTCASRASSARRRGNH
jgi:hypothetical protein